MSATLIVAIHPDDVRRRLVPDETQLQVILGSLLGRARICGAVGERWMRVVHDAAEHDYVLWKYERLASLAHDAPVTGQGRVGFRTIPHPLFDDLDALFPRRRSRVVRELLAPLGLAVWLTDLRRVELRADLFVLRQREPRSVTNIAGAHRAAAPAPRHDRNVMPLGALRRFRGRSTAPCRRGRDASGRDLLPPDGRR